MGGVTTIGLGGSGRIIGEGVPAVFLIVGGGGGGGGGRTGNGAGGGGGGGGIVCGSAFFVTGRTYTITVGTGGWQQTCATVGVGTLGNTSSIIAAGTNITAFGGGGGGAQGTNGPAAGGSSGGGRGSGAASTPNLATAAAQPGQQQILERGSTYTNRGFPGGTGFGPRVGGGGGGAGATGGSGSPGGQTGGGNGGAGYTWPFTANTYAGGGGGGADACAGSAGPGGGGAGFAGAANAASGVINTGGGGGGTGQFTPAYGGKGGHGIIILGVPTPFYAAPKYPGAAVSTPVNAPGMTILSYTAPAPGSAPGSYTFIP